MNKVIRVNFYNLRKRRIEITIQLDILNSIKGIIINSNTIKMHKEWDIKIEI